MANGVAHALVEPPAVPAHPATDKPATASIDVGELVAIAAVVVSGAVDGYRQTGVLDPTCKDEGATRIAKVAELQLGFHGSDDDFIRKARAAGRGVLWQYFESGLLRHRNRADADRAIDVAIDDVFEIVAYVVKTERNYRTKLAN